MEYEKKSVEIPSWLTQAVRHQDIDLSTSFVSIDNFVEKLGKSKEFKEHFGFLPRKTWINYTLDTQGRDQGLRWHDERTRGVPREEANRLSIIWVEGDTSSGGGISLQLDDVVHIPFEPKTMLTVDSNVMHKVDGYESNYNPRVSLMILWKE